MSCRQFERSTGLRELDQLHGPWSEPIIMPLVNDARHVIEDFGRRMRQRATSCIRPHTLRFWQGSRPRHPSCLRHRNALKGHRRRRNLLAQGRSGQPANSSDIISSRWRKELSIAATFASINRCLRCSGFRSHGQRCGATRAPLECSPGLVLDAPCRPTAI